jgi:hypothetical protein
MSGSASRSQLSRFDKRRLMLLMLKLAIFIGSDGSERIDFNGRIAPSVAHPNQNLMQWKVSERPAPLAGAGSAPKPFTPSRLLKKVFRSSILRPRFRFVRLSTPV